MRNSHSEWSRNHLPELSKQVFSKRHVHNGWSNLGWLETREKNGFCNPFSVYYHRFVFLYLDASIHHHLSSPVKLPVS